MEMVLTWNDGTNYDDIYINSMSSKNDLIYEKIHVLLTFNRMYFK